MRTWMAWIIVVSGLVAGTRVGAGEPATQGAVSNTMHSTRELALSPKDSLGRSDVQAALREFTLREGKKQLGIEGLEPVIESAGFYGSRGGYGGGVAEAKEQGPTITLNLPPNAPKKAAKELMDQIVKELERLLIEEYEGPAKKREALERRQLDFKKETAAIEDHIGELRMMIGKVTRQADSSPEGVRAAMSKLDQERQTLAIDLVGLEARQEALQKTIAEQSKRMEDKVSADAISAELKKVVEVRTARLTEARNQYQAGVAGSADVAAATGALAEAKAKLLEREELVASRSGGDLLAGWNKELLSLSIDRAEKSARAKFIDQRLDGYREAGAIMSKMEELQARLPKLRREADEAGELVKEYQQSERPTVRPLVGVKSAKDD